MSCAPKGHKTWLGHLVCKPRARRRRWLPLLRNTRGRTRTRALGRRQQPAHTPRVMPVRTPVAASGFGLTVPQEGACMRTGWRIPTQTRTMAAGVVYSRLDRDGANVDPGLRGRPLALFAAGTPSHSMRRPRTSFKRVQEPPLRRSRPGRRMEHAIPSPAPEWAKRDSQGPFRAETPGSFCLFCRLFLLVAARGNWLAQAVLCAKVRQNGATPANFVLTGGMLLISSHGEKT